MFLNSYRRRLRAAALMPGIVTEERRFEDESGALRGVAAIRHPQDLASIMISAVACSIPCPHQKVHPHHKEPLISGYERRQYVTPELRGARYAPLVSCRETISMISRPQKQIAEVNACASACSAHQENAESKAVLQWRRRDPAQSPIKLLTHK
jgi:hypothetical protein